ncbi:hypothetical protein SYNPS1DRAFT_26229 [Syncephalis pseudoplumigaleata]|uniref:Uncharacterized protein n=1 Tax=Syncephalis pseudoplumigaleata TaxID=1712513 RepID=A0A4P9Z6G6_9FUNG|nr:hypothetical protein SYNPS1DRAFT_26229 [Syncephalis pseudoplumigaleata]|eukprot:RKP28196.1 hypothetical protein SYNPS1DRAFT_26229 [Syncephalis pseudoplumigaleata]
MCEEMRLCNGASKRIANDRCATIVPPVSSCLPIVHFMPATAGVPQPASTVGDSNRAHDRSVTRRRYTGRSAKDAHGAASGALGGAPQQSTHRAAGNSRKHGARASSHGVRGTNDEWQELRERSLASQERIHRINVLKRPEYKPLQGLFDKSLPWPAPLIRQSEATKRQKQAATVKASSAASSEPALASTKDGALVEGEHPTLTASNASDEELLRAMDEEACKQQQQQQQQTKDDDPVDALSEQDIDALLRPNYTASPELDALLDNVLSKSVPNYQPQQASPSRAAAYARHPPTTKKTAPPASTASTLAGKLRERQNLVQRLYSRADQSSAPALSSKFKPS